MSQYEYGDYNKGGLIAFAFSMIFTLGFFIYISLIYEGVDLGELPAQATAADGGGAQDAAAGADFDVSQVTDPWISSDGLIAHGKSLFNMQCALCHGESGRGDGVAGSGLIPPPRDLVEGDWQRGGTSIELFETLTEGFGVGSSMASYAHLPAVDRWALVHYIRDLTENEVPDDPQALEEFGKASVQ